MSSDEFKKLTDKEQEEITNAAIDWFRARADKDVLPMITYAKGFADGAMFQKRAPDPLEYDFRQLLRTILHEKNRLVINSAIVGIAEQYHKRHFPNDDGGQ